MIGAMPVRAMMQVVPMPVAPATMRVLAALVIVLRTKTVALAWAMLLSVPNAMRWNMPSMP